INSNVPHPLRRRVGLFTSFNRRSPVAVETYCAIPGSASTTPRPADLPTTPRTRPTRRSMRPALVGFFWSCIAGMLGSEGRALLAKLQPLHFWKMTAEDPGLMWPLAFVKLAALAQLAVAVAVVHMDEPGPVSARPAPITNAWIPT